MGPGVQGGCEELDRRGGAGRGAPGGHRAPGPEGTGGEQGSKAVSGAWPGAWVRAARWGAESPAGGG